MYIFSSCHRCLYNVVFPTNINFILFICILSELSIQCLQSYSLHSFALQSPEMPFRGDGWAVHYDSDNHQIWFLNPRMCATYGGCTYTTHVVVYDVYNNSFKIESSTPEPMTLHETSNCATSIGDTVYFNDATNLVIGSYNIRTSEWKRPFVMIPYDVSGACLVSDDRYVYVIGGSIGNKALNYFQIYDVNNHVWLSPTNALNHSRFWSTCQIHNGTIYVFGGYDPPTKLQSIEMIFVGSGDDVATNAAAQSWQLLSETFNYGTLGLSSAICTHIDTDIIYLTGGWYSSPLNAIYIFDLNTHSLTLIPFTLSQGRTGHASICIDNYFYLFGGRISQVAETTSSREKSNMLYYIAPTEETTTAPSSVPTSLPSSSPTDTSNSPTMSELATVVTNKVTAVDCPDAIEADTCNKSDCTSLVYTLFVLLILSGTAIIILFLKLKDVMKPNIAHYDPANINIDNEGAQEMARAEHEEEKHEVAANAAIADTAH